jgi:hypothetical protein
MADSSNLKKIRDSKRRYKPGVLKYAQMGTSRSTTMSWPCSE